MKSVYGTLDKILIQNQETLDAILAWRPQPTEFVNTELQRGFIQSFAPSDLEANGLPRTNLGAGARTTVINNYLDRIKPVQLTTGDGVTLIDKWVVTARTAEPYIEYWKRPAAEGGLSIDNGQGGTRDLIVNQTADICHLDESFNPTILALSQVEQPQE